MGLCVWKGKLNPALFSFTPDKKWYSFLHIFAKLCRQCQKHFSNVLEDLLKTKGWKTEFIPTSLPTIDSQHSSRWTRATQFCTKLQRHHPGGSLSCQRQLSTSGTPHLQSHLSNLFFHWKGRRMMMQLHENLSSGALPPKETEDWTGR